MSKSKKLMLVLIAILIPAVGFGLNYFNWNGSKDVSPNQTLTVDGGIDVTNISSEQKLVPGDKICETIQFNIESTAPSFIRVKVDTSYSNDGGALTTPADIGTIEVKNEKWVSYGDYYYYTEAVDKKTTGVLPFADSIIFEVKDDKANTYQNKYIHAKITAEMIQVKHGVFADIWNIPSSEPLYTTLKTISDQTK